MPERPNPPGRMSPLGRLPTRSFRKSGPVQNPSPLPAAMTPAPRPGLLPSSSSKHGPSAPIPGALVDHDIACGILVGIFDPGPHTVTMDQITEIDPTTKAPKFQKNWIKPNDIIGALTRMFLVARQATMEAPVAANMPAGQKSQQLKAREEAMARHNELKRQIYDVLRFRDVLERAQRSGFRTIFSPPEPPMSGSGSLRR